MPQINLGKVRGEQGPKGEPGPKGDTGPKGPKGDKGLGIEVKDKVTDANNFLKPGYCKTDIDGANLPKALDLQSKEGVIGYITDRGDEEQADRGTQIYYSLYGNKAGEIYTRHRKDNMWFNTDWDKILTTHNAYEKHEVYPRSEWKADYQLVDKEGDLEHAHIVFPYVINFRNHNYKIVQEFVTVPRSESGVLNIELIKLNLPGSEIINAHYTEEKQADGSGATVTSFYIQHKQDEGGHDILQINTKGKGKVMVSVTGLMRV